MPKQYQKVGYQVQPRCNICRAKSTKGEPLRDEADARVLNGETQEDVTKWLRSEGNNIYPSQLTQHLKKHSPYIMTARNAGTKVSRIVRMKAEITKVDADAALQKIIDIGSKMIEDGTMPVTERLYMDALKEQGRRGNKTLLDVMMMEMDKESVEEEAIQGEEVQNESKQLTA